MHLTMKPVQEAAAMEARSAFAFGGNRIIRQSEPMTIGKHEWRLTLYRCPHYERPLIGYEWRRLDRAPMRRACRAGVWYLGGSTWMRDTDWPSYNHNDGQYAGMPRTLRKLWERCPWAHTPETRPERPCPLLDGIQPEPAHET